MSIEKYLAYGIDPVLFAKKCGIEPDPWQADLLRSNANQMILLCSRQSGKSTVTALVSIHHAIYKPKSIILLLSPSLRQSQELFKKAKSHLDELPFDVRPAIKKESALQLELFNGSRIISLPEKEDTIRGFSGVSLLIIDEAAFVKDSFYLSVRPMLAVSKGRLIALSTPHRKRGWFYDAWTKGEQSWKKYKVTADQCPRITKEFLESEKTHMPISVFEQEYMCEFKDSKDSVFSHDLIQDAISDEVKPLNLFKRRGL